MTIPRRYEPSDTNDSGGMGDIMYCNDNHLQRDVVIKTLRDDVEQGRLLDEQRSLIQLRSKHVVQLYDVIKIGQKTGLVLEFIEGDDLVSGAYELDMSGLVETLWQVACGLADIHEAGIIHRDIKPNNIRRDESGVIKIFDFGLARKLDCAQTNSIIGTVMFMAPELCVDGGVEFTSAVDVYAFGITAIALANANVPQELKVYPPQPLNSGWAKNSLPSLDSGIAYILEQCLEYLPENRTTIADVEMVLRKHLLKNKHKGVLIMGNEYRELNSQNQRVKVYSKNDEITIEYDGYDFKVAALSGSVTVNNVSATVGHILPGASVITLGSGPARGFVTFDISHPEVVS